uniref:Dickkopf N-terminal cysteine-rich domain-containing protein n=1 Tax=Panagrolaimus sp. ES5 TaxID=591445 RepID=A0AC34FP91_9BILA
MCNRHYDCNFMKDIFLCCLCSVPGCYVDDDCGPGTACMDGSCIGIRKLYKSQNINLTALNEFNHGYICKNDEDCEDGSFCFNGDCVPNFMKKEHERFKRGEASVPSGANRAKGYRCSCHCIKAEQHTSDW